MGRFVNPQPGWERCLADLQILTRMLHKIADAMLSQDSPELFKALHDMQVYCEKFKTSLWKEN
jgi:hypothetical protein